MQCVGYSRFVVNLRSNSSETGTDIVYLNMCGNDMIVLSSSEIIEDLSDKKSAIYSDKVTALYHICSTRY